MKYPCGHAKTKANTYRERRQAAGGHRVIYERCLTCKLDQSRANYERKQRDIGARPWGRCELNEVWK